MKKIVFALKVTGLIAMFPMVVVLEMNHTTGNLPENNFPSGDTEKTEKASFHLSENSKEKNVNGLFSITQEMLSLKTAF